MRRVRHAQWYRDQETAETIKFLRLWEEEKARATIPAEITTANMMITKMTAIAIGWASA